MISLVNIATAHEPANRSALLRALEILQILEREGRLAAADQGMIAWIQQKLAT